jgi:hypothetical protein
MHVMCFTHIHPLMTMFIPYSLSFPLFALLQIVPLSHSCLCPPLLRSRLHVWEKTCNIFLSESALFCLTWWFPVPFFLQMT